MSAIKNCVKNFDFLCMKYHASNNRMLICVCHSLGLEFILTSITWSRLEFTDRNIRCMDITLPRLYREVVHNMAIQIELHLIFLTNLSFFAAFPVKRVKWKE